MKKDLGILVTFILCGLGLYFIPLHSTSFYFDDRSAIVNNEAIKSIDIPKIFNAFNTRFLPGLSFAFNYKWCALDPSGFRLINLFIHCLNAFLVYLLAKQFWQFPGIPAGIAGILFLCHPIQTEAVNSITQRFVLMGSFFYLLTLFLYIRYRLCSQKRYLAAGLLAGLAAMFCKEFTVTLPLMLALYDFYFLDHAHESVSKTGIRLAPFFAIALIVPVLLLKTSPETVRAADIAGSNAIHHVDITRAKGSLKRREYFLTQLNVLRTYVRLLFLPVRQNFDYDYPVSRHIDAKTLLSGVFLLCLLILAFISYKSYRIVSFSILWFFVTLSVESSFIPIGHVIAEYRLYLASVGFVFLLTFLIYSRPVERKMSLIIAAAVLIVFSCLTFQRNMVWRDEFTLWNDVVQKSPHKARGYLNRGLDYFTQGKFTEAIADFNKTIELDPHSAAAYNDLGVLFAAKGDLPQALTDFNKAIAIKPDYADAYKNRLKAYQQLKENEK